MTKHNNRTQVQARVYLCRHPDGTPPHVAITTDPTAPDLESEHTELLGYETLPAPVTTQHLLERLISTGQAALYPARYGADTVLAHIPGQEMRRMLLAVVDAKTFDNLPQPDAEGTFDITTESGETLTLKQFASGTVGSDETR